MLTEKELKKIFKRNEKGYARDKRKYERGVRREVKRVIKLLKKQNKHIKGYVPYAQDVYQYMNLHSQYTASSRKQVEQYMSEAK